MRSWRTDQLQMCNFYQGITTHKNNYDFVTIKPHRGRLTKTAMKPDTHSRLINGWKS